ncbi:MAG TPA: GAF domain-containing protein [Gemmatimonadales bacterium]|nr:GAF domain-containing protein [Gemmatimonadales bacterium]
MTDDVLQLTARIQSLEAERRQLLTVVEILEEIGGAAQFTDIVQAVARRLGEALGLDRCSIFLAEKGGRSARLVASFEDPSIRNYMVDLDRYPELRRALETGQTVIIADAASDPGLQSIQKALKDRKVKSITVVPIKWRGAAIGAIFLRTFRDGQPFADGDIRFVEVVASLTAKALRNAHRIERLQQRVGGDAVLDPQQAVLAEFLRRLLTQATARGRNISMAQATQEELDRLVGVTLTVLAQEADLH